MREPEPETIRRARDGDVRAFESLVRAYQGDAWRFAYHLTRNRAAADDVTQEAFLKAFRALPAYRGDAKFTSWLLRIVRNCAVDAYRRTQHEDPVDLWTPTRATTSSTPTSSSDDRIRIAAAISSLPPDLREPFVVIEVLGFTYHEAATILGVNVGTLKSRMHRARAKLVESLGPMEAADEM